MKFVKVVNTLKIRVGDFLFYLKTQPQHAKSTLCNNTKTNDVFCRS